MRKEENLLQAYAISIHYAKDNRSFHNLLFCCFHEFAFGGTPNKVKVKPMSTSIAISLIQKQKDTYKSLKTIQDIEPDKNCFELYIGSKLFYFLSGTKESTLKSNLYRCTILLLDSTGKIKSALDSIVPTDDESVWSCDGAEAMSFRDFYADGSLKIIAIYHVTPPSNEYFNVPIILKLNFKESSLEIDKSLTHQLEEANLNTIQAVRSYLKKLPAREQH
jgi:hypothetical protein